MAGNIPDRCFACNRVLRSPRLVDTRDAQFVYVGPECFKHVQAAGAAGYLPPLGGPRLFPMPDARELRRRIVAHGGSRRDAQGVGTYTRCTCVTCETLRDYLGIPREEV